MKKAKYKIGDVGYVNHPRDDYPIIHKVSIMGIKFYPRMDSFYCDVSFPNGYTTDFPEDRVYISPEEYASGIIAKKKAEHKVEIQRMEKALDGGACVFD